MIDLHPTARHDDAAIGDRRPVADERGTARPGLAQYAAPVRVRAEPAAFDQHVARDRLRHQPRLGIAGRAAAMDLDDPRHAFAIARPLTCVDTSINILPSSSCWFRSKSSAKQYCNMVGKARPGKMTDVTQINDLLYSTGQFVLVYDENEEFNFTLARLEEDLMENQDYVKATFLARVKDSHFKLDAEDSVRAKFLVGPVSETDLKISYDKDSAQPKKETDSEDSPRLQPLRELTVQAKPYKTMIATVKRFRLEETEEEESSEESEKEEDEEGKPESKEKESKTLRIKGKKSEPKKEKLGVKSKRVASSDEEDETEKQSKAPKKKEKPKPTEFKRGKWNPNVSLTDTCEQLESESLVPNFECSTRNSNRELIRAAKIGSRKLLDKVLDSNYKISRVTERWGVDNSTTAFKVFIDKGDVDSLIYLLEAVNPQNTKKTVSIKFGLDNIVYLQKIDTGFNDKFAYGVATRKVNVSRGGRQGNNAFVEDAALNSSNSLDEKHVIYFLSSSATTPDMVSKFLGFFPSFEHQFISKVAEALRLGGRRDVADMLIMRGTKNDGYGLGEFFHLALTAKSESALKNLKKVNCTKKAFAVNNLTPIHCACLNPNPAIIKTFMAANQGEFQVLDDALRKPLHYAACCESAEPLKYLIEQNCDPREHDNQKNNALMYASIAGRVEAVRFLLDKDRVSPLLKNRAGYSALHYAAEHGHIGVIDLLLDKGVKIAFPGPDRKTALHIAAAIGDYEMVKHLVERGAKVLSKDKLKRTPLLLACKNGNLRVASYLLQQGSPFDEGDSSGNTPLHYACAYGYPELIEVLFNAGANPNSANSWNLTPTAVALLKSYFSCLRKMLDNPQTDVNCVDDEGRTLVSNAVKTINAENYSHVAFLLKDKKADPNIPDSKGLTAFDYLCCHRIVSDEIDMTPDMTLEEIQQANADRKTLYKKYFKLFIDCGSDINHRDPQGLTPIFRAFDAYNLDGVSYLLDERNIELSLISKDNRSIFHAVRNIVGQDGLLVVGDKLLAKCPLPELLNKYADDGETPLHTIIRQFTSIVGNLKANIYQRLERNLKLQKRSLNKPMDIEGKAKKTKKMDGEGEDQYDEDEEDDESDDDEEFRKKSPKESKKYKGLKGGARSKQAFMARTKRNNMRFGGGQAQFNPELGGIMITEEERIRLNQEAENQFNDKVGEFLEFLQHYKHKGGDPQLLMKQPKKPKKEVQEGDEEEEIVLDIADFLTYYTDLIAQAVKNKFDIPEKDRPAKTVGYSLLHIAMQNPMPKLIDFLLEQYRMRLNQKSVYGESELLRFIDLNGEALSEMTVFEALIKAGANIEQANIQGVTPILLAMKKNKYGYVSSLIGYRANVNVQDLEGNYCLMQAIKNNNLHIVETLLRYSANPNLLDQNKRNCVHWAINNSAADADASNEIENALLSSGGNLNAIDIKGRTPLHYAFVKIGQPLDYSPIDPIETVSNIISRQNVEVDVRDKWGNTPLNYAAQRGSVISALYLLKNEANINNQNDEGNTPLNECLVNGHQNMCIFLLQKDANLKIDVKVRSEARKKQITDDENEGKSSLQSLEEEDADLPNNGMYYGQLNKMARPNRYGKGTRRKKMDAEKEKEEVEYESSDSELEKQEKGNLGEGDDKEEEEEEVASTQQFNPFGGSMRNNPGLFGAKAFKKRAMGEMAHEDQSIIPVQFNKGEKVCSTFSVAIRRNWQSVAFLMLEYKFDLSLAILDCFNFGKFNYVYTLLLKKAEAGVYQTTNKEGQNLTHLFAHNSRRIEQSLFDKILGKLEAKNLDFASKDNLGRSSLHYSCQAGCVKLINILLGKGLDPNLSDNSGMTPLGLLLINWLSLVVDFVKMAQAFRLDVNKTFVFDKKQHTALTYIVSEEKPFDTFTKLVDLGADINKGDSDGWTPIVYYIRQNKDDEVKNFVKTFKKVDMRAVDREGRSLIHHVVKPRDFGAYENISLLEFLAGYCDVNQRDSKGFAPLYYAKAQASGKMQKVLLKLKAIDDNMEPGLLRTSTTNLASIILSGEKPDVEGDFEKFLEQCKAEAEKQRDRFEEKCQVDSNAQGNYEVVYDDRDPYDCYLVKVDISTDTTLVTLSTRCRSCGRR